MQNPSRKKADMQPKNHSQAKERLGIKDDMNSLIFQGGELMKAGKWQAAAQAWVEAIKLNNPAMPDGVYVRLANAYRRLGRDKDIVNLLQTAIKKNADSIALYREVFLAHLESGNSEAAIFIAISASLAVRSEADKSEVREFLFRGMSRFMSRGTK